MTAIFVPKKAGTSIPLWIILPSILAGLFLLDILTTQLILNLGGMELNPMMSGVVNSPFLHMLLKIGILILVIAVAIIAEARVKGSGTALYAVLIVMYTVVILNNASVILPHLLAG
ncbi:MAG: DUF5658 family protein [Methanoregula sp.]|jgi:hypothetical protein|uniref:DUF5658 family protein n=1 Tax=Methanoregula sp. TaxID=2052170 RepID=UPI003BB134C8